MSSSSALSAPRQPWGKSGVLILVLAVLLGGALRIYDIGGPSFSDDEVFKVRAVESYRQGQWTLTGDDEHPLAMKLLIYVSYAIRDLWNTHVAGDNKVLELGLESATRGPNALVGTLISLLLAFLARELFSRRAGLIAALLWAVEVNVIGYNRIAKEDTLLTFFLLLGLYFAVRAKRTAESGDAARSRRYEIFAAMSVAGLCATKYFLHLALLVPLFYVWSRYGSDTLWRISWKRWLALTGIVVVTFLALNPTVLDPDNLRYMRDYIGHRTVYHHGYLFFDRLFMNNAFEGFSGTPWYYYFSYLGVKLSIPMLFAALVGLAIALRHRRQDGFRIIFLWLGVWLTVHAFLSGAKWGRFVLHLMPPVLLLAAVGVERGVAWLQAGLARLGRMGRAPALGGALAAAAGAGMISPSVNAAFETAPHYRMYLNAFGGSQDNLRRYFPHCDFYDVGLREAVQYVCARAETGAQIRSDAVVAVRHYVDMCGRSDLKVTTLSKKEDGCDAGRPCYQILQVGRTYYETQALMDSLHAQRLPDAVVSASGVNVAEIYGPELSPAIDLAVQTAGEALRMGELAHAFGNAPRGKTVAFERNASRMAGTQPRLAARTSAYRFAGDVIVEKNTFLDPGSPSK